MNRIWKIWTVSVFGSFLVLEAYALRKPKGGTLSESARGWMGIDPAATRRWAVSGVFVGFWAWLIGHIVLGWGPNDIPRRSRR